MPSPKHANDHEREGARTSGVTHRSWSSRRQSLAAATSPFHYNVGSPEWFRKWLANNSFSQFAFRSEPNHSAGATARVRSFSTPFTSTAIAAVATTKPSAMTPVIPSTRPKPPLPYRNAMVATAAPEDRKVKK